jgi:hypothetical protein
MKSKHAYTRSCFSWAHYTVNAQNGFGGYARGNYIVFFLDGEPILKMSDDHPYYSQPNSDYVADQVIALSRAFGTYVGDECSSDVELRKQREKKNAELELDDSKNYNQINQLIDQGKIEEAWSKYRQLNFQSKFPRRNELESKRDDLIIKKVRSCLEKSDISCAISESHELRLINNINIVKIEIQQKVESQFSNDSLPINEKNLQTIVLDNKIIFSKLSPGEHFIRVDKVGNLLVDGKVSGKMAETRVAIKDVYGFRIQVSSFGKVLIKVTADSKGFEDSIRLTIPQERSRKNLYFSKKENFYFGAYGAPFFSSNCGNYIDNSKINTRVPIKLSNDLNDKIIVEGLYREIIQVQIFDEKLENKLSELLISESKKYRAIRDYNVRKGTGRKIFRTVTLPVWLPFWFLFSDTDIFDSLYPQY